MSHALPGEDLFEAGLRDLREGRESIATHIILRIGLGSRLPEPFEFRES